MSRRFSGYVDIHTHILPYVDDGSDSVKATIEMINQEYEEGVRKIIATPHYGRWNPKYNPEYAKLVFSKIRDAIKLIHPDMELYFGNEIFYSHCITNDIKSGKASTLAGTSYVLIEFEPTNPYSKIEQGVRECIQSGYWPIIAHIERYKCLRNKPELVSDLIRFGAYVQVNAQTLLIEKKLFAFDKMQKLQQNKFNFVINLAKEGHVHFVASDCHNMDTRKPLMEDAVDVIEDEVGYEIARDITYRNVGKLLRGERIY